MTSIQGTNTLALPSTLAGTESAPTGLASQTTMTGGTPQNILHALEKAAQGFSANTTTAPGATSSLGAVNPNFIVNYSQNQVMLSEAQNLAQDAFTKVSNPNASNADRLIAQAEMAQAQQLRTTAAKGLPKNVQSQITQISKMEQNAFKRVEFTGSANSENYLFAQYEMQQGAQLTQQVDSELNPKPLPLLPGKITPFLR